MSRVMGPRGPLMYSPRTDSLSYPAAQETYDAAGTALPTSEPATSQVIYTITSADLPVSTDKTASMKFTAFLYGGGKNNGASSATVYYRILKNGASVATGSSSVNANYYYTVNCYQLYDVKAGDVIEIRLWASATTVDYRYKAMSVVISRYVPGGILGRLLLNFHYLSSGAGYQLTLSQGVSPIRMTAGNVYIYTDKTLFNSNHYLAIVFGDLYRHAAFVCIQDKQFFHLQNGDSSQATSVLTSSVALPYYYSNCRMSGTLTHTPTGIFIP